MAAQGRDIKLAKARVEGYRNFSTKLWNATKFAQMNGCALVEGFDPASVKHTLNKWIVSEAVRATKAVEQGIADYRFNDAAGAIYGFTWNVFCDWYIELTKPIFLGADEATKTETRATAAWALDQIVHLLHPFMPYVTEELFQEFGKAIGREGLLISREWPTLDEALIDASADAEVNWVIRLITSIRSTRSDLNVPAGAKVPMTLAGASAQTVQRLDTYRTLIERLARLESVSVAAEPPKGDVRIVLDEATVCLEVASLVDLKAEIARLEKEVAKHKADIAGIDKKLSNEQFVAKAPPEVIEEQHTRRSAAEAGIQKLGDALAQLKAAG
jgi:valyl-tRNA synthetase